MRPHRGALLDSHVLLWTLTDSTLIGARLRRTIDKGSPLFFSAVSIAETALKTQLGLLTTPPDFAERLVRLGMRELPLDAQSAAAITRFPGLMRHDPFDQLLVAQAVTHNLTLETADRKLLALGIPGIKDATSEKD